MPKEPSTICFPRPIRKTNSDEKSKNWMNFAVITRKQPDLESLQENKSLQTQNVAVKPKSIAQVFQLNHVSDFMQKKGSDDLTGSSHDGDKLQADFESFVKKRTYVAKPNNFINMVKNAVLKFFFGVQISTEDIATHYNVYNILRAVILQKHKQFYLSKATPSTFDKFFVEKMVIRINSLIKTRQTDRKTDEKTTFVFKMCMDPIMTSFFVENNLAHTTKNELKFYNYYFAETAVSMGRSLKIFYNPLSKTRLVNEFFTICRKKYFKVLLSSDKFSNRFSEFLKRECYQEYRKKVCNVIDGYFAELDLSLMNDSLSESEINKCIEKFVEYAEVRRILRMPWHIVEAKDAFETFEKLIQSINTKLI